MIRAVKAFIDENGTVHLLEPVELPARRHAIVTILDDEAVAAADSPLAHLSEASFAQDWNRPEEDAAWSHLKPEP